jgi:hypothetical protein
MEAPSKERKEQQKCESKNLILHIFLVAMFKLSSTGSAGRWKFHLNPRLRILCCAGEYGVTVRNVNELQLKYLPELALRSSILRAPHFFCGAIFSLLIKFMARRGLFRWLTSPHTGLEFGASKRIIGQKWIIKNTLPSGPS